VDAVIPGKTGIITRDETPASVADAIAELLNHPDQYQDFRANGVARIEAFRWSRILPAACDQLEEWARR
jgi:glycosyltransferase involved in cell wall biosynthesis